MSENLSLGPLQVFDNDVASINDALRQVCDRIDEAKGLRGRALIFDRTQVSAPAEGTDAVNLDAANSALLPFVTTDGNQTITGEKIFTAPVRILGDDGELIHAFGALV